MKNYFLLRSKHDQFSFLLPKSPLRNVVILGIVSLLIAVLSACLGDIVISLPDLWRVLIGQGDSLHQLVITQFRLPRIIVGLAVGVGLAMGGAILQGMVRNPLASPDIIGITSGAGAAVVGFLALFSDTNNALTVPIYWLPVAAFIGALATALLIYVLAWKDGVSPIRLVLIGIGIAAFMQAIRTLLMLVGPIYQAAQANIWITGTLNGVKWSNVTLIVPIIAVLSLLTLFMARHLTVQELGDDLATSLGQSVQIKRFLLLILSTALVSTAVAFAGGIGFVGLLAPHIARRLVGQTYGLLLPASAFIGAILVLVADLLGRILFLPLEVPAGVFTAAIGAPYFIYLLFRKPTS